jgi:hypothetical protein
MSYNGDHKAKKETGHDPAFAWRLKRVDKLETQSTPRY